MKQSTSNHSPTAQVTLFDVGEPHLPVLPYGGTSGWAGSETSKQRATKADSNGVTSINQKQTLILLRQANSHGLIWSDLTEAFGWHHGTASGALSVLHKAGLIARLTEKRNKCAIYVALEHVNGRETQPHRPNVSARLLAEILDELETDLANGHISTALARVRATKQALQ
jgi:DNA-binding MarR family transcriptional regulator